jgi:hypothetical protein
MAKTPPKTNNTGRVSPTAAKWLGKDRVCVECGDVKSISEKTFAISKKHMGGWHTTCRVCQAHEVSVKGEIDAKGVRSVTGEPEAIPAGVAAQTSPTRTLPPSQQESLATEDMIEDMYLEYLKPRPDVDKLKEIVDELSKRVRELPDEESFRLFVEIVKPLVAGWMEPGPIHDDIISGLMSNHRRRLVIATRYSAKSTLTAIWIAWRIFREPLIKIMVISRGSKLAARMLRTVRQVFIANCPMLENLKPTDECLDNAEQFQVPAAVKVVTGGATLTSLGVTSNLPGFRSDLTVCDDIEGPQEDTPEKVEDLHELLNELHMINPKGEKIMLGTYQSEFSLYAKLADLEDREGNSIWENHRACMFDEDDIGIHSRWPAMFSDADAEDWRGAVTTRAWRLHAMLIADPSILNERPLKIGQFITVNWPTDVGDFPETCEPGGSPLADLRSWSAPKGDVWRGPGDFGGRAVQYQRTIASVDPASGLAGRDAIGFSVVSVTAAGQAVIRHLEGIRGPDKIGNIRRCAQLIIRFNTDHIVVEELADGLFGETLENQLLLMGSHMKVEKVTTGGQQKGRRIIETLAPPMANGRIIMLQDVSQSDHGGEFANQLVRITYDGRTGKAKDHDDIVDALAHAIKTCRGDLVSDIASNRASAAADRVDNWRGLGLRFGGLGLSEHDEGLAGRAVSLGDPATSGLSMGERLVEEDAVLVQYEERLAVLLESYKTLARQRASAEQLMLVRKKIDNTQQVVNDLKELDVI